MKRSILLSTLILLLAGHCFAFGATFPEKRECLPSGLHDSRCRLAWGDTISQDVAAVYGSWRAHKAEFIKANPALASHLDRVRAGQSVVFPNVTLDSRATAVATTPSAQPRATVADGDIALKNLLSRSATGSPISTGSMPGFAVEIPTEEIAQANLPLSEFPSRMIATATAMPPVAISRPSDTRRITGYKLMIPQEVVVAAGGIPLGVPLLAHYYLYNPETGRPCGYIRLKKKAFARQEGNVIALYVPFAQLPTQPWSLKVDGVNNLIDGRLFIANATAIQGKLPGPHHGMKRLFVMATTGGSAYTLLAAFGPGGPIALGSAIAMSAYMHHHANAIVEHAEKTYNATLASNQGNTPSREAGQ